MLFKVSKIKYYITFSVALIHKDSKSTAFESFKHFSRSLFNCTDISVCLPLSKYGAAIGVNSMFIFNMPSLGLEDFGTCTSHETCAKTLIFSGGIINFSLRSISYLVLPRETQQQPQSWPNFMSIWRNSSNARLSTRYKRHIELKMQCITSQIHILSILTGIYLRIVFRSWKLWFFLLLTCLNFNIT